MKKLLLSVVILSSTSAFAEVGNKFSYTPDGYLISIHKAETSGAAQGARTVAPEPQQQQEIVKPVSNDNSKDPS